MGALLRYRVGKYDSQAIPNELGIFGHTVSGANINETTALTISTVYACTYKIASTVASLGLEVYEKSGREIQPANVHPAYDVIKYRPNEYQTAYEFWETIVSMAVLHGCGYALIERDNRGYVTNLIGLDYYDVDRKFVNGQPVFSVKNVGMVQAENMLEICNLQRKSPIRLHRENLGLAKAARNLARNILAAAAK